ncbi:MAG: hypothetical protein WB998_12670 [Solirubrobacteraceae bacterium]
MQSQGTCTVLIPSELVDSVRDGLRSQLAVAAQHIISADEQANAGEHPERYRDALRYMDALRALLEKIGWSAPTSDRRVDLQAHGLALIEALEDQVDVHADMLRDIAEDDERRVAMARKVAALTSLALTVLLKVQAQILREGCSSMCERGLWCSAQSM